MIEFLNFNNEQITSFNLSIASGESRQLLLRTLCKSGYKLSANTVSDLAIEARLIGDTNWTDIVNDPIDLTPYDGEYKDFEVKCTAGEITDIRYNVIEIINSR